MGEEWVGVGLLYRRANILGWVFGARVSSFPPSLSLYKCASVYPCMYRYRCAGANLCFDCLHSTLWDHQGPFLLI